MTAVRFGVGHDFRNLDPTRWSWPEMYRQTVERVVLAEQLGFDYFFVGEHHFTADGHAPSLFSVLAAVAQATRTIRLATYVFLLPLHHPLHVAEDVTAVDLLSDGRMELGVGQGYRREEFDAFGVERSKRGELMDEACEILRKAWTEQRWSFEGHHFRIPEITVTPAPVQTPHPKLWISARNERAARRAARLRCPLMIAPAPYVDDPAVVYRAYAEELEAAGEDPAAYDVMGSFTVRVLDPGDPPLDMASALARDDSYVEWYTKDGDLPTDAERIANPSPQLQRAMGVTGPAPRCIAAIGELLEQVPFTTLMVGGVSRSQMERFAAQVAPAFR